MARSARAKKRKPVSDPNIRIVQIENPMWSRDHDGRRDNPRYVHAMISLRESAIVTLHARGALGEAQYRAAEIFRHLFEATGGKGAGAIDYTREYVDGGRFPDPLGDNQIDAGKKLAAAYEYLTAEHGTYSWRLLAAVCGEGRSIHDMTATRRDRDTMTDNLRLYLDCLCRHWRLAG